MSCDNGCMRPPERFVINLDDKDLDVEKLWDRVWRTAAVYGSAEVKINWQNPEKYTEFWGKSTVNNIKCTQCNGRGAVLDLQTGPDAWEICNCQK
jgi:hypothetical protein